MSHTKRIGERISCAHNDSSFTTVIDQSISKAKLRLLVGWWLSWGLVGLALVWERSSTEVPDERMFLTISLAFWAFFAFRIGKVIAWRMWGTERIRISADAFSVKNAFGNYGRAHQIPLSSVERIEVVKRDPAKFLHSMDQSFWIMGGDSLMIRAAGKRIPIGKQLSDKEAGALAKELDRAIRSFR